MQDPMMNRESMMEPRQIGMDSMIDRRNSQPMSKNQMRKMRRANPSCMDYMRDWNKRMTNEMRVVIMDHVMRHTRGCPMQNQVAEMFNELTFNVPERESDQNKRNEPFRRRDNERKKSPIRRDNREELKEETI